jgi:CheY-like chemotaxis protein
MLRLVTTNNTEIFRHLGSKPFQALGVEHCVAADYQSALELIRTKRPRVAIIDTELAGGDAYELCRVIKADPDLREVRMMLVVPSVVSHLQLQKVRDCGCDDVLALPMHSDDFYYHIADTAGLRFRRQQRIQLGLRLTLVAGTRTIEAFLENISLGGVGIHLRQELKRGQEVSLALEYEGQRYPDILAVVVWSVAHPDGEYRAGLAFADTPIASRLLIEELCLFDLEHTGPGTATVSLHGDFTEKTDLSLLSKGLEGVQRIDFNMREVRYISSAGVRVWSEFLGALGPRAYSFRHASIAFMSQVAMIPSMTGSGDIVSFEAPYHCETCDYDDVRLLEHKSLVNVHGTIVPPPLHCSSCGGELLFDDIPRRYFAFALRR